VYKKTKKKQKDHIDRSTKIIQIFLSHTHTLTQTDTQTQTDWQTQTDGQTGSTVAGPPRRRSWPGMCPSARPTQWATAPIAPRTTTPPPPLRLPPLLCEGYKGANIVERGGLVVVGKKAFENAIR
jgi:hypothetical protein